MLKSDTNQLQYNLKSDTGPACPCPKSNSSAQLAWCCCVSFCRSIQFYLHTINHLDWYLCFHWLDQRKKIDIWANIRASGEVLQRFSNSTSLFCECSQWAGAGHQHNTIWGLPLEIILIQMKIEFLSQRRKYFVYNILKVICLNDRMQ